MRNPDLQAWLDGILGAGADAELTFDPAPAHTLELALRALPEPAPPRDLVARPSPARAGAWHVGALASALAGAPTPAARERARYHARWLAHLLAPGDPERAPLVSVVIPVFDDAELVLRAVASCLAQTHPRLEVLVVDDGSNDRPDQALAPLLARATRFHDVRVLRKSRGGVASARNLGIAAARGELVHFLDADDELDPDAVAEKLAALRAVPDAELCTSELRGADGADGAEVNILLGDRFCPTVDLLATCVRRHAFFASSVLVPRWVLLETGPFDEEYERCEDTRYWFRLALRDTRVIALRHPLHTRRLRPMGLSASAVDMSYWSAAASLASVEDLLVRPSRWRHLGPLLRRASSPFRWRSAGRLARGPLGAAQEALLGAIERLGALGRVDGLTPRTPLALVRAHLAARVTAGRDDFAAAVEAVLAGAFARTPEPDARDVRFWLAGAPLRENAAALELVLAWAAGRVRDGQAPLPRAELATLARAAGCGALVGQLSALGRVPRFVPDRLAWLAAGLLAGLPGSSPSTNRDRAVPERKPRIGAEASDG